MRKLLLSFLVLFGFCKFCWAQSERSDELFAQGVELYKAERYQEAIEPFMQAYRLDSLELDSLSPRKNYSLSWIASCYYKIGDIVNARKYAPYDYMVAPIDRRLTKQVDSLSAIIWKDIQNQRFALALSEVKEEARLEKLLCDSNHTFNLGTNQSFSICYNGLQEIDSAIYYLRKNLRIERLYFEENDSLFLSTLNDLSNCLFNVRNYESAREVNQEMISIIQYWWGDSVPAYAEMAYRKVFLFLAEREWQNARLELQSYLGVLQRCFKDNKDALRSCYFTMMNLLNNCGMKGEAEEINDMIIDLDRQDIRAVLDAKLMKMATKIKDRDTCTSQSIEGEIDALLSQQDKDSLMDVRAAFECIRVIGMFYDQKWDEAESLFLQIQRDSIEQFLDKKSGWYLPYLVSKFDICVMLSDYEGGLLAIDDMIALIPQERMIDNLDIPAMKACMFAYNGDYSKAREIAEETIRQYDETVVRYGMAYRLEKDTAQVSQIVSMLEMRIQYADALPDSAKYVMREIKAEFLLLKARLLANLKRYQIDIDYYECITDYALELIKMKKFIEAQEVMNKYIEECKACYESIDEHSKEEDDVFDRFLGRMNYGEALAFRRRCYEKGDPNGAKAYWDYVEYVKEDYSESKDMEQVGDYLDAMYSYYKYTDNQTELLEFLNRTIDDFKPSVMKTLADLYLQLDQPQQYVSTLKKYVIVSLQDEEARDKNASDILNVIDDIGRFYVQQKDTLALLDYYKKDLWPSFDVCGDSYMEFFLRSIYELRYKVKDETFIPYVETEMNRKQNLFKKDTRYAACVNQAIAAILMTQKLQNAESYMRQAYQQVEKDSVLGYYFACNLHELLYENWGGHYTIRQSDEALDSIIAFGFDLIAHMTSKPSYTKTADFANLLKRQAYMLQKAKRYDEMLELCEQYVQLFGEMEYVSDLIRLHPTSHHLFSFLVHSPMAPYFASYHLRYIQDLMFYTTACFRPSSEKAVKYTQEKIHNEYDIVETSMAVNSVSPDECDKLISTTCKMAFKFQNDSLKMAAYDAALFGKGLQLRSDFAIRALIQKSGHKSALRKFDELQHTMRLMTNAPESKIDSLQKRRKTLEDELRRMSSMFGDYKTALYTSWKDVQKGLKQDEAAIEFTLVEKDYEETYFTNDTTILEGYYALILRKDKSFPEILFISSKDSLSNVGAKLNSNMTSKVFTPMKPYLRDVKKIYFSPIGALNQIPLESFSIEDNANHPEYNFYRVSSTRELVTQHQAIIGNDAVVYGGLKYDTSIEELEEDATLYPEVAENRAFDFSVNVDSLGVRHAVASSIKYLAGTKSEAEDITTTINNRHDSLLVAQSYIGPEGTEASFKSLNNKQKRIIHIATHGFYYTEKEARQHGLTPAESTLRLREEDRALTRSGLFFAGADNKYQGDFIPVGIEDGILTAQEISNINLSGADMVVLSACQTAQGDNTSEGVFGLQRGFKKAGAQSILMSLWKVDDEATCLLMTEFYKNWMGGATKHDALETAKQTVRSHTEKGWDDPKYWAAFILLDALD